MINFLYSHWDSFFHDRTGVHGCQVAGYLRIGFAFLFLIDRVLLLVNSDYFFSPDTGLLPYRVSRRHYELVQYNQISIFALFPESNAFVRIVSVIGILQGIIVLLGATKYPRFHLFGIYLNIMSFLNHNALMWDGEDTMLRMWVILFLFFPLDHCTIHDRFGFVSHSSSSSLSSSWPMWIFRIFQIEMVIIYMGASLGKLADPYWRDGSAIYRISYGTEDYPGIYNPDFVFGRYGPLKLLCWTALLLESTCYIMVWIPSMRKLSVVLMIFLHIGIDLTMNMHIFEWLSCLGWCVFLIQPTVSAKMNETNVDEANGLGTKVMKAFINVFVASFIFTVSLDAIPYEDIGELVPKAIKPAWERLNDQRTVLFSEIDLLITPIGLSQGGDWGMYTDVHVELTHSRIDALLANGTQVNNIWRSPDWSKMSSWGRKFHSRSLNYYGDIHENKAELLRLVEMASKPFLENGNTVDTLTFINEARTYKKHEMESSTGGFWGPVKKYPMDVRNEAKILVVQVRHCQDTLSAAVCARMIETHGCRSHLEQCGKSCLKECNGHYFLVKYWGGSPNYADYGHTNHHVLGGIYSDEL